MIGALDLLGAEEEAPSQEGAAEAPAQSGTDWSAILKTAGEAGMAAYQAYKSSQDAKKGTGEERAKLAAVVAADVTAAQMTAGLASAASILRMTPKKTKNRAVVQKRFNKAKTDAQAAVAAQTAAVAALPASQVEGRATAARAALDAARASAQANPKSTSAKNLVKAWQQIVNKAQAAQASVPQDMQATQAATATEQINPETKFYDRKIGPFTFKQYGIGAAGLLIAGLVVRKVRSK